MSPPSPARAALLGLMLGYAGLYSALAVLRYENFHAQIDMSFYLRLVWGLAHGYLDHPLVQTPHVLGLHLEPVLLPLAGLAALGVPLAPLLLVVQAVAVALLAWPAYRLAARALPSASEATALLLAGLALLYPTVTVQTLFDFHPVTLALAPLLGVVDALHEGKRRRALWLAALALACREDIALQLALCFAAWTWPQQAMPGWQRQRWLWRGLLPLLLCAYFLIYILIIQPPFLPAQGAYTLHFPRIGGVTATSGPVLLRAVLAHPLDLLSYLISDDRPRYALRLLWPVGLLPLLAPRALIGALPVVAINLLSGFPRVRTLEAHYATAIIPFVLGAAILGCGRLCAVLPPRARALVLGGVTVLGGLAHLTHGASPLALRSARWAATGIRATSQRPALVAAVQAVPPSASVCAPPGLLSHLAERPRIQSAPDYEDGRPVDVRLTLVP